MLSPMNQSTAARTDGDRVDPSGLPDPKITPTLRVEKAGALFGLGRSKSYEEANRYLRSGGTAGLPTIRFGTRLCCPTARVLALLGLEAVEKQP